MISGDIEVWVWYLCPNFVFGYSLTGNSLSFQKGMLLIFKVGTLPLIAGGGDYVTRYPRGSEDEPLPRAAGHLQILPWLS